MIRKDERGGVPVFAVFAIFIILITGTALIHFRTAGRRQAETIRMLTATDIARARASAIESDLNDMLKLAIRDAMFMVGEKAGTKEGVKKLF